MLWVVYVDMDAYYVSCEVRDRPELEGKPVIVGHRPENGPSRGVVLSASYAARAFGVHSAMPVQQAARRCPEAIWVRPDFTKYGQVAEEIRTFLGRWADVVVPLSIDEAALQVDLDGVDGVEAWARDVQGSLREELRLPCSIGASPYAVVAKVACDAAKPGGIKVVSAEGTEAFLRPLPVGALPGIGPKTAERLVALGVKLVGDLATTPAETLRKALGGWADSVRELAMGRPPPAMSVLPEHAGPVQRSLDRTLREDTRDPAVVERTLGEMAEELARSVAEEGYRYQLVVVRLRWQDFTQLQRGRTLAAATEGSAPLGREAVRLARELLERERAGRDRAVRRISLSAGRLAPRHGRTVPLDEFAAAPTTR